MFISIIFQCKSQCFSRKEAEHFKSSEKGLLLFEFTQRPWECDILIHLVKHKCPYNDTLESCFWNPIWLDYVRRVAPRVAQSLIPRDRSSFKAFKAFKNLKIDSRVEVPLPHLSRLPKTGSCWGWKFCGSLWIWSVWNKPRLEAPFADCRGNTIHSMGKTQTKSPFHWTDIYFFEMQHDSLLFSAVKHQWGNWIWNTNIFCYF